MSRVEVNTQAELDNALKNQEPGDYIVCLGGTWDRPLTISQGTIEAYGSSQVTAYGSSQVRACGSSQVRAYGSSQVTACDSSQVTAYDSSQVRACDSSQVTAYDSSQVTAYDSSQVRAYGSSQVTASQYVAVTSNSSRGYGWPRINGGVLIETPKIDTAEAWLDYYGIEVTEGIAVLYKAVDNDYGANHNGFKYLPGTTPEAPDWKPTAACGNGLHFCARPWVAKDRYNAKATRFVACPVLVADLVVIDESKVKGPRVVAPCFEVDQDGEPK